LAVSVTANTLLVTEHDPASQTVAEYVAAWLAHVRGRVRAATYEGYEALKARPAVIPRGGAFVEDLPVASSPRPL
jgi:hypothetical protein